MSMQHDTLWVATGKLLLRNCALFLSVVVSAMLSRAATDARGDSKMTH
jgi:hypothetical protein